jgi:hypothetical protein
VGSERPRLFNIYAAGNFIEATPDTPFFQIGEHKYGKPILDRVARSDMELGEAAKMVLLSFDSTLRSNLSVGLPIDLLTYEAGMLKIEHTKRIGLDAVNRMVQGTAHGIREYRGSGYLRGTLPQPLRLQHLANRLCRLVDDLGQFGVRHVIRRGEDHHVAIDAINISANRIADEAVS